jgi:hypothetical protein
MTENPAPMLLEQQKRPAQEAAAQERHEHYSLHAEPLPRHSFEDTRSAMVKPIAGRSAAGVTQTALCQEAKDRSGLERKQVPHHPGSVESPLGMKQGVIAGTLLKWAVQFQTLMALPQRYGFPEKAAMMGLVGGLGALVIGILPAAHEVLKPLGLLVYVFLAALGGACGMVLYLFATSVYAYGHPPMLKAENDEER